VKRWPVVFIADGQVPVAGEPGDCMFRNLRFPRFLGWLRAWSDRTRKEPRVAAPEKYPDKSRARAVRLYLGVGPEADDPQARPTVGRASRGAAELDPPSRYQPARPDPEVIVRFVKNSRHPVELVLGVRTGEGAYSTVVCSRRGHPSGDRDLGAAT
jgi:hypothetical protein